MDNKQADTLVANLIVATVITALYYFVYPDSKED